MNNEFEKIKIISFFDNILNNTIITEKEKSLIKEKFEQTPFELLFRLQVFLIENPDQLRVLISKIIKKTFLEDKAKWEKFILNEIEEAKEKVLG